MIRFVIVALIGLAIFILFRVLRLFLARSESHRLRNSIVYVVPIEILVWSTYFFRSLEYFFGTKSYYDYLLTALVLTGLGLLVWFYLKEVVAGAFFRLQHNPKTGRHLQASNLEGIIRRISATHIYLDTGSGKVVRLPFSKLVGSAFSLSAHKESAQDFKFSIRVSRTASRDETTNRIRQALLLSPYCSYKEPVEIRITDESSDTYACHVAVRPVSQHFGSRIEKDLAEVLNTSDIASG
ncbi:MAG TPA: mechanosensitive ion channel domain-containing protein [Cyclobacteriaceae bacterium]|jgi:small-conductance mechanosensitive channel